MLGTVFECAQLPVPIPMVHPFAGARCGDPASAAVGVAAATTASAGEGKTQRVQIHSYMGEHGEYCALEPPAAVASHPRPPGVAAGGCGRIVFRSWLVGGRLRVERWARDAPTGGADVRLAR